MTRAERAATQRESSVARRRRAPATRAIEAICVACSFVVIAAVGIALHLSYYTVDRFAQPVGSDTASYLWRSRLAGALGLDAVPGSSPFEFHANSANPDRLGLPALAAVVRWTTGVGPYRLMFVLPAICAVVLGLAAYALARSMDEPRWGAAVWGVAGATSVALAVTARGYFDNVLVDPILVAAAATLLLSIELRGPVVVSVLLVVAAVLTHYLVAALVLVVFIAFGFVLAPGSLRARRSGTPWWKTPSGRVAVTVGAGAVFGGIGLLATPGAHAYATRDRTGYAENLKVQLPAYRLRLTLAPALLGAVGMGVRGGHVRRRGLALLLVWGGLILVGGIVYALGTSIPFQRLLGMAFPLTFLGAAALTSLVAFAIRARGWRRYALGAAAWTLVVLALIGSVRLGRDALGGIEPISSARATAIERTAADYLARKGVQAPVIVVANHGSAEIDFNGIPAFRRMRALVPGARVPDVAVYVGDVERLLTGQPTVDPANPELTATSKLYWDHLSAFLGPETVILVVQPFDSDFGALARAHPDWQVAPGVLVAQGPPAHGGLTPASPPATPARGDLIGWTLWPLLLCFVCGAGWAVSFVPLGWAERVALAPALGMAAIVVVAYALGMAGLPLRGGPPVAMAALAAALGWMPAGARALRAHRPASA